MILSIVMLFLLTLQVIAYGVFEEEMSAFQKILCLCWMFAFAFCSVLINYHTF